MPDQQIPRRPGDPRDPTGVILYRLEQIERRIDRLLTLEVYAARDESTTRRLEALEAQQDDADRSIRQLLAGLVSTVLAAAVVAGLTIL